MWSVPQTPSGNAPFDFNQLNQQHDMQLQTSQHDMELPTTQHNTQPSMAHEHQNLLQGFGSNQDLQQEIDPNDSSSSL